MKPTKQTVYLPLKIEHPTDKSFDVKKGYFFTPEQLNQLLSDVIKDTLNTAAENVTTYDTTDNSTPLVDEKSITNTFEETYKKFKV